MLRRKKPRAHATPRAGRLPPPSPPQHGAMLYPVCHRGCATTSRSVTACARRTASANSPARESSANPTARATSPGSPSRAPAGAERVGCPSGGGSARAATESLPAVPAAALLLEEPGRVMIGGSCPNAASLRIRCSGKRRPRCCSARNPRPPPAVLSEVTSTRAHCHRRSCRRGRRGRRRG